MAITLVGTPQMNQGGVASLAVNKPTGVASGDVLLCMALVEDAASTPTVTQPTGWVSLGAFVNTSSPTTGAGSVWIQIWRKVAGGSEPGSYTFGFSTSSWNVVLCAAYRGVDNTTPIDASSSGGTGGTSNVASFSLPAITTTAANDELVILAGNYNGFTINSTGFTSEFNSSGYAELDKAATTAGSYGPFTATFGANDHGGGWLIALKPAGGSTTTTQTLTSTARITAQSTQTRTATARITATSTKTNTSTARITATSSQSRTSTARITATSTRTQTSIARITAKATQTRTSIARITAKTQQTNTSTAHIVATGTSTQTRTSTARIQVTTTRTNTSTARLQRTGTQTRTSTARITATSTQTRSSTARVQATTQRTLNSTARIFNPASIVIGTCKVSDTIAQGAIMVSDKQTNTATLADKSANTVALVDSAVNSVTLRDVAVGRAALTDI